MASQDDCLVVMVGVLVWVAVHHRMDTGVAVGVVLEERWPQLCRDYPLEQILLRE